MSNQEKYELYYIQKDASGKTLFSGRSERIAVSPEDAIEELKKTFGRKFFNKDYFFVRALVMQSAGQDSSNDTN